MLTDDQLLRDLAEQVSPPDVTALVRRLLRVPEVWEGLHQPGLVASLAAEHDLRSLLPGTVAAHALGLPSLCISTRVPATTTPGEPATSAAPTGLQTLGAKALELLRASESDGPASAEMILAEPDDWRSALACAWPHLPEPGATLQALIPDDNGLSLAANALLANLPDEGAAHTLQTAATVDAALLSRLVKLGEAAWVRVLSDSVSHSAVKRIRTSAAPEPTALLHSAVCHRARREHALARQALQQGWNEAQALAASIADELATLAEQESDPVTALSARQQALQIAGTPARRAAVACSLIDRKRPEEAVALLPAEPSSTEERIALGLAMIELGDPSLASAHLIAAAQSPMASLPAAWLERLEAALRSLGRIDLALHVSTALIARFPLDGHVRLQHAHLLLAAGHGDAAVSEASLALALGPDLPEARRTFASALQSAGRPGQALPHWQLLASHDATHDLDLARCALEAADLDTATHAVTRVFDREAPPPGAHVVLAEVLRLKGRVEEARTHLEQASALAPQDPEPWIALARLHELQDDHETAASILQSAVQLAPHCGPLYAALASWHKSQGRLSRALEAIEIALRLDASEAEWAVERGDLLRLLGRVREAMSVLSEALARKPGSLRARLGLALCCEVVGDVAQASHLLADLPSDANFDAHLLAGRVCTRAASEDLMPDLLARAKTHLQRALQANPADPQVHYWLAELHSLANETEAALRCHSRAAELASHADPSFQQEVLLALGRSAIAAGNNRLALRVLEEGRQRFPDSMAFLTSLSQAYQAAGRCQHALEVARQALAAHPDSPVALRGLARAAVSLGLWPEALQAYRTLAHIDPHAVDTWLEYAKAAHSAGEIGLARSALARALLAGRGMSSKIIATANILAEFGWQRTAQTALEHALSRAPGDASLLRHLALISEAQADAATAHRAWSALADVLPEDVTIMTHAAEASSRLGKRAAAIGFLQRAVALCPQNAEIQARLARVQRENGDLAASLKHYALAMQSAPDDIDLAIEAASTAVDQGALGDALSWLEQARAVEPNRYDATILLAECLLRLDRVTECRRELEALARRTALTARGAAILALARASSLGIAPALEAFRTACALPVSTASDAMWAARAALRLGQWSDAIRFSHVAVDAAGPSDKTESLLHLTTAMLHCLEVGWLLRSAEALEHMPHLEIDTAKIGPLLDQVAAHNAHTGRLHELRTRLLCFTASGNGIPSDAPALALIVHHLRLGKPAEAIRSLQGTASLGPEAAWTHLALGVAHEALSDGTQARAAFEQAALDALIQPVSSFLIGRTLQAEADIVRAIQAYNAAVAAWPNEPLWHHRLATLYLAADDLPTALPHLQQAAELAPDNASIALSLGRALRLDGQLSEAKAAYARALPAFPTDDVVWKEAGELALALGDAESAEAWFDRACTLSPSDARCLIGAARAAAALGKARLAVDRAQAAARLAPADPDVLLGLGEVLARLGKAEKALQAYDQALAHGNRFPITLARARLLVQMGRAGEAALEVKHLIDTQPDSDVAWAALAEACAAARHSDEALQAASRAVRLAPRSLAHRLLLSRLCREAGQLDRALKEIKEAQALQPADAAVWTELGSTYAARREMNQALESFQRAITLDPSSGKAHFLAGLMYKQLKAYAQAGRMFKKAVELNPKDSEAFHQLAAVNALELVHGALAHSAVTP